MKLRLTIESGRHLPGKKQGSGGAYVAWLEVDGHAVTGELASHADRDTAEVMAAAEVTRRLRSLLGGKRGVDDDADAAGTG